MEGGGILFLGMIVGFIMGYGVAMAYFASKLRALNNTKTDLTNRNDPTRKIAIEEFCLNMTDQNKMMVVRHQSSVCLKDIADDAKELRDILDSDFYVQVASSPFSKGIISEVDTRNMSIAELAVISNAIWSYATGGAIPADVEASEYKQFSGRVMSVIRERFKILNSTKFESLGEEVFNDLQEAHVSEVS